MSLFYTGRDLETYNKGYKFVPQEKYLKNPFNFPNLETKSSTTNIASAPVTYNYQTGQSGIVPGSTNSLVDDFNLAITERQKRINEANRPLRPAQFPSFPGVSNAQTMYNKAAANFAKDPNSLTETFTGMRPSKQVMDHYNEQIMDYQEKVRTGQFGPSFIPAEKPTIGRKISDFVYDNVPFIDRPQSATDILQYGYKEPSFTMPGITGILSQLGLRTYSGLPRGQQAFIASRTGYQGPTIFGDNLGNQDPFGINVQSMFGNYADYSRKEAARLEEQLEKSKDKWEDTYGSLDTTNQYGKTWEEMNKLNITKSNFYNQNVVDLDNYVADANLIDKARKEEIRQAQGNIDRRETAINRASERGQAINKDEGVGSVNPNSAYGKAQGYKGGHANPHTQTGWSGATKSNESTGKGKGKSRGRDPDDRMASGGRVGYFYGGLASIL